MVLLGLKALILKWFTNLSTFYLIYCKSSVVNGLLYLNLGTLYLNVLCRTSIWNWSKQNSYWELQLNLLCWLDLAPDQGRGCPLGTGSTETSSSTAGTQEPQQAPILSDLCCNIFLARATEHKYANRQAANALHHILIYTLVEIFRRFRKDIPETTWCIKTVFPHVKFP